jgi:hypothetical protein
MRNVLLFTLALGLATTGTVFATGNPHEVGGGPEKGHTVPLYTTASAMRFQCMWFQEEIGDKGSIARVELMFQSYGGATPSSFEGFKVILCHSSKDALTNTFQKNYDFKTPVEVFSGKFAVPEGLEEGDWFTIAEPDNFTYNNRNNLLMEISWTKATGTTTKTFISTADQPGRLRAFNATAETGKLLPNQGHIARLTIGNPAVSPTSLGRIKTLLN